MTPEQFDKFLKEIGGVHVSWRKGLRVDGSFLECGPGWNQLIADLMTKLIDKGWDRNIAQVKEKFGQLRFYVDTKTAEQDELIRAAENKSAEICEICGEEGKLKGTHGLWQTRCKEHEN